MAVRLHARANGGASGKKRKTYLLAFIDDHSRLVPHGEFYLSESVPSYLKALEEALLTRGLPRKIYTDNGTAFRSHHVEHVTASLGIALIHARPYKPQGKGKIESFFRTVRGEFLTGFKGNALAEPEPGFILVAGRDLPPEETLINRANSLCPIYLAYGMPQRSA